MTGGQRQGGPAGARLPLVTGNVGKSSTACEQAEAKGGADGACETLAEAMAVG